MADKRDDPARPAWLRGLRTYLISTGLGHLAWEILQLPLYTIWDQGTLRTQAFAVIHCTLGDLLIALSALILALLLVGDEAWPRRHFWRAAGLTLMLGVAYTVFSEWLNVVIRASWAYAERMPVVTLFGFRLGLSPLMQWIAVPLAAFAFVRRATANVAHPDRPTGAAAALPDRDDENGRGSAKQ